MWKPWLSSHWKPNQCILGKTRWHTKPVCWKVYSFSWFEETALFFERTVIEYSFLVDHVVCILNKNSRLFIKWISAFLLIVKCTYNPRKLWRFFFRCQYRCTEQIYINDIHKDRYIKYTLCSSYILSRYVMQNCVYIIIIILITINICTLLTSTYKINRTTAITP